MGGTVNLHTTSHFRAATSHDVCALSCVDWCGWVCVANFPPTHPSLFVSDVARPCLVTRDTRRRAVGRRVPLLLRFASLRSRRPCVPRDSRRRAVGWPPPCAAAASLRFALRFLCFALRFASVSPLSVRAAPCPSLLLFVPPMSGWRAQGRHRGSPASRGIGPCSSARPLTARARGRGAS